MTPQRKLLPYLTQQILLDHPDCSIILIGSVARGEERPENSDLDLNVFFPSEPDPSVWISEENRWQLQVKQTIKGIRIDVAWETLDFLEHEMTTDGPFWIISCGEVIHDPGNRVARCLQMARKWTEENVELCNELEANFRAAKAKQLARRKRD